MPFHYSNTAVWWSYHNDKPAKYDPTTQNLIDWDAQLITTYEEALTDILPEFNLTTDKRTKSRVIQLAIVSNGSSVRAQVRNACKFLANAMAVSG